MFERSAANQQLPHVDNKRPAPPQDDTAGENPEDPEGGSLATQRFLGRGIHVFCVLC